MSLHLNAPDEPMRDTVQHVCPFEKEARAAAPDLGDHRVGLGELAQPGTMISPIRNTTVYLAHFHSHVPQAECARPDPFNPATIDRAIGGNTRTARRNVPVNTSVKPLKKR